MRQSVIRRVWLVFIAMSNVAFIGYLQYYQNPGGIVFGLPETWVVLFVLMLSVFLVNTVFAWYYLNKPDLREVFGGTPQDGGGA